MKIRKITLENFRQFRDKQAIEFSICDKQNVTVILGQNTSGKTTLIQAFSWCLYGKTNFKSSKELINKDAIIDTPLGSSQAMYVEVELEHDGRLYTVRRSQKSVKLLDGKVRTEDARFAVSYKESELGQTKNVDFMDCTAVVEQILPEQLSDYFFFAGEHIDKINSKGNVRDAVRGLMGLEVISNGMDRFDPKKQGSVISKLRASLDTKADSSSGKLQLDLEQAQKRLAGFEDRKKQLEDEIEILRTEIEKKDAIIAANQTTKLRQEERARLEREIKTLEERLINDEKNFLSNFMRGHFKFYATPLYVKTLKVIADAKGKGEGVPKMHGDSIDYILERERCICGTDLRRNQGAVDELKKEQKLLPPESIGTLVFNFRQQCEGFLRDAKEYASAVEQSYIAIRQTKNMLADKKQRLKDISKEISNGDVNVAKIEHERREMDTSLRRNLDILRDNAERIGEEKNKIANAEKQIDGLVAGSEKNKKIKKALAYAYAIYDWFKVDYDKNVKEVKDGLNKSISEIFTEMFHGRRIVEVDENYRITLKIDDGHGGFVLDPSMGEEAVKNFAFISGLVALAREKAQKKDFVDTEEVEITTEPYPLVMDAPFSNTDDVHIANISSVVPKIAEQVIFIIMKKDWDVAKSAMDGCVGKIFEIEKHSQTISNIRGGFN